MEGKGIYIGKTVMFGWGTVRNNLGFFIGVFLVGYLLQSGPQHLAKFMGKGLIFVTVALYLISIIIACLFHMGYIKISLGFCDGKQRRFADLFTCFPLLLKYILGYIVYALIFLAGIILLIFPAVIWSIKFGFWPYFVVDKKMGPIAALKNSARITAGVKWDLLGFYAVTSVISLIGILCMLVGILVAAPIVMVATTLVYRELLSQTESAEPVAVAAADD